jgi:hypothetical protein
MFDVRWGDDPRDADPREADQSRRRDHDDTRSLGRGGGGSDRQSGDEPPQYAPDQPAAPGSFTSRLSVCVVALLQRADRARERAKICPQNRGPFCRNADAPILDCSGAKARVKASLRPVGAARP